MVVNSKYGATMPHVVFKKAVDLGNDISLPFKETMSRDFFRPSVFSSIKYYPRLKLELADLFDCNV
jgi:hypothetical protein